jgi:hypothetical protein
MPDNGSDRVVSAVTSDRARPSPIASPGYVRPEAATSARTRLTPRERETKRRVAVPKRCAAAPRSSRPVARTSTLALTSATLPYLVRVATHGVAGAAARDPVLAKGLTTLGGNLVSQPVAEAHGLPYQDPTTLLPAGPNAEAA